MMKKILFAMVMLAVLPMVTAKTLEVTPYACPFDSVAGQSEAKILDFMIQEVSDLPGSAIFAQSTADCMMSSTCDDTDGGIVFDEQGTVSGLFEFNGVEYDYSFTDFCSPCQEEVLIEFYCTDGCEDNEWPSFTTEVCEFGCDNGECIDEQIPEFGLVAATIAMIGALIGFMVLRKRK
ncbi:MAG: hypothetical protein KKG59_06725 [Nanoarchaeota archaeon]|nr:hypothetical protein [Nanoarchaeota archaeon]